MAKRSRKNIRRVIAIIASLVLVFGLLPVTASAAGEGPGDAGGQAPDAPQAVATAEPEAPPAPAGKADNDAAKGDKARDNGAQGGAETSGEKPEEAGDGKAETPAGGNGENAPRAASADGAAGGGKAEAPAEGAGEGAPEAAPVGAGVAEGKDVPAGQAENPGKAGDPAPTEPAAAGAKAQFPAFRQSRTVGGVVVTVEAEAGAFPEGARLSVAAVPSSRTEAAVAPERDDGENVAASYTFDIKVLGEDGTELQPAGGRPVRVSFAAAEVADPNLEVSVYHVSGGAAEELAVSESGSTATATSKGFSYYTVEFTYGKLQYVLPGGESVPLADVLAAVGLQGEPEAAESSDPGLFAVEKGDGVWTVAARKAFHTEETLTVTINGTDYAIEVTDDDGSTGYGLINGIPASDGGYVWMGGDNAVKWHVIGKNDSNWLLISNELIGGGSHDMNWNRAKAYCATTFSGFSDVEQAAVPVTTKSEPADYKYESSQLYYFGPSSINANLFLLSSEEAETYFSSDAARQPGFWWLRSPYILEDDYAGIVNSDGKVDFLNADYAFHYFGVRPAFRLNLSSVLFSSAAEGGKSSTGEGLGSFGTITKPSGDNEVKLTLIDELSSSARKDFSANVDGADSAAVAQGGSFTISYSGAAGGDHISALLCDSEGTISYYASTEQSSDGTWAVTLPDYLTGSYKLKVFSEQQNGDWKTDYVSPVSEIALNVTTFYTVTFVDEDGTTVLKEAKEYPVGTAAEDIEKPADPTKEATAQYTYTFATWTPEVVAVTGDATYKAKYDETPRLYSVKWLNDDGTEFYRDVKVPYGTMPKFEGATPTKPSDDKYAYEFAGWEPKLTDVTGDAAYTAKYKATPRKGTLTFDLAGGTLDGKTGKITVEANVGDTVKLPGAPTKKGYAFKFWKGSEYAAGAEYKVEGDHAFAAEWAAVHTVTFDANGHGKAPDAQEVEHGWKAKRPANPTADGYTFGGWYTDKACKEAYDFSTPVTEDITLYAKWTKKSSGTSPKTGDPLAGAFAIVLALAAASALALATSRRMRRG